MKKAVLLSTILTLFIGMFTVHVPVATHAAITFPFSETFTSDTASVTAQGWQLLGDATLTSGSEDPSGQGWLRLTSNAIIPGVGQAGSAIYNNAFPSSEGIRVEFQYATYGAERSPGADGISFYLIDGNTASPTVGAQGAGLGYGIESGLGAPGVTNGYIGIGLDEWGNFATPLSGACDPSCPSNTPIPQSVTIRGSGNLHEGFNYLTHKTLSPQTIDEVPREEARWVRMTLANQHVTVEIDYGAGYETVIDNYDLSTAPGQAALPATFKMGFSASNYNPANYHEIRNLTVTSAKPSTTVLTTSSTTFTYGQSVTFTATVSGTGGTPTGTVSFFDGSTLLGTGTLDNTGTATLTTTTISSGTRKITARYSGDITFGSSTSSTVTVTVTGLTSTTTLTSSLTSVSYGQEIIFTATVVGGSGTPTGKVTFFDGTTRLGSAMIKATGQATYKISSLSSGTHTITARYEGGGAYASSTSSAVTITVSSSSYTTIDVHAQVTTTASGSTVTFTVTASGSGGTPTGTFTFRDGSTVLGTATLDATGHATFTTGVLVSGSHSFTVEYSGDGNFSSNSSTITVLVTGTTTSTTNVLITRINQTTTFTVTVTGSSGTPTGNIIIRDYGTVIGTIALDGSGQAVFTTTSLSSGAHELTIEYEGDATFAGSTFSITLPAVGVTTTTTTVTTTVSGQKVSFTIVVSGQGGTPTGRVLLYDGDVLIGSASLKSDGKVTYTTDTLTSGSHTFIIKYEGDGTFAASSSSITLMVSGSAATTTTLTVTQIGSSVTFTVSVVGTGGTPTGTVTLRSGSTVIGTITLDANGQGTFTTTTLAVGTYTIIAYYGGDPTFAPSSSSGRTITIGDTRAQESDLSITQTYEIVFLHDTTFTIVARNNGPNAMDGAVVSDTPLPASLNNLPWTWTCIGSNGATCSASGTGDINDTLTSFPSGGTVTYTVRGHLADWSRWTNTARISPPLNLSDTNTLNNSATVGRYQLLFPLIYTKP